MVCSVINPTISYPPHAYCIRNTPQHTPSGLRSTNAIPPSARRSRGSLSSTNKTSTYTSRLCGGCRAYNLCRCDIIPLRVDNFYHHSASLSFHSGYHDFHSFSGGAAITHTPATVARKP